MRALGVIAVAATAVVIACDKDTNSLLTVGSGNNAAAAATIVGFAEVTLRDIGRPEMTSEAILASTPAELEALRAARVSNPAAVATTPLPIQVSLITVGSLTLTSPSGQSTRYMRATFGVRNTRADSVVFDRTRENVTFVAVNATGTIGQTAVSSLLRRDGSSANPILAPLLTPTGLIADDGNGGTIDLAPDVVRVLTTSDLAKIAAPAATGKVLAYGFVVRNAPPDFAQFEGDVTFAFGFPVQPVDADNPNTISVLFVIVKS